MATQTAQAFTAEERRQYLGASEIAAVMGQSPYATPLTIFNIKTGRTEPPRETEAMRRGNIYEPIAADLYTELTGIKLRRWTQAFKHPEYPFLVCHVDRLVPGTDKVAEIKTVHSIRFAKIKREGLPIEFIIQGQMILGLSGRKAMTWIIYCADLHDALTLEMDFDEAIYQAAVEAGVKFWTEHVLTDTPPAMDAAEQKQELEIQKIGGNVTMRDDDAFVTAMQMKLEAKRLKAEVEELDALANERLREAVENVYGIYEGGGGRLYLTQQAGRKTLDKKALAAAHPEIDLSKFEKIGQPFDVLKVYEVKN